MQICETLGDIVAFSKPETRVLKDLYVLVPDMFKEDFEAVITAAQTAYDAEVFKAKNLGTGEKSSSIKKRIVAEIIEPWLYDHNLSNFAIQKKSVKGQPKLPSQKTTVERRTPIVNVELDQQEVADLFDNYNWDADVFTEIPDSPEEESEFDFGELFDSEDGFSLDSLGF